MITDPSVTDLRINSQRGGPAVFQAQGQQDAVLTAQPAVGSTFFHSRVPSVGVWKLPHEGSLLLFSEHSLGARASAQGCCNRTLTTPSQFGWIVAIWGRVRVPVSDISWCFGLDRSPAHEPGASSRWSDIVCSRNDATWAITSSRIARWNSIVCPAPSTTW